MQEATNTMQHDELADCNMIGAKQRNMHQKRHDQKRTATKTGKARRLTLFPISHRSQLELSRAGSFLSAADFQ